MEATGKPFEEVISEHRSALRCRAFKLTRNTQDSDDLVNDTYLMALRKKHLFKPGTNLKGWLSTILFNIFVNQYRRKVKRGPVVSLDDVSEHIASVNDDPAKAVSHYDLSDLTKHALESLHPRYRTVFELVVFGDHNYKDAAKKLDIPIGTVMSRLSRARSFLRQYLEQEGYQQAA